MTRAAGILLGLLLTAVSGALLWRPPGPSLEEQGFHALYTSSPASRLQAVQLYRQALAADPLSPYRWCDLAEAWLEAANPQQARDCMRRAQELGPFIPQVWVRAANLHFRLADQPAALQAAARVLHITPAYDAILFRYYGQFVSHPSLVLASLDGNPRAAIAYFRHSLASGDPETGQAAWEWLAAQSYTTDPLAVEYLDFLVARKQPLQAAGIWVRHLGQRSGDFPLLNRLFNGGFESESTGAILDWRIHPVGQVVAVRDSAVAFEGRWSLRLTFAGDQNVAYAHTAQTAVLPPGRYRLRGMARCEGLTTDQGLVLRATGQGLDARTPQITGSADWTELVTSFSVAAPVNLVTVQVLREPSYKFDSKIAGTAWFDAVRLESAVDRIRHQ